MSRKKKIPSAKAPVKKKSIPRKPVGRRTRKRKPAPAPAAAAIPPAGAQQAEPSPPPEPPKPPQGEGSISKAAGQVNEAKRRGRPPELTPEVHQVLITAISSGQPETRVGGLVGLDKTIVAKWKARGRQAEADWNRTDEAGNPILSEAQKLIEAPYIQFLNDVMAALPKLEFSCLAVINRAKNSGDAKAAYLLLKLKFAEYRETVKVVGDPEGEPVFTKADAGLPMGTEERIARAKKARAIMDLEDTEPEPAPAPQPAAEGAPADGTPAA